METARTALEQFKPQMIENIARIKTIRGLMFELLTACGSRPIPSGGNYLLTEFSDAMPMRFGMDWLLKELAFVSSQANRY